jgi:hypothetical protein
MSDLISNLTKQNIYITLVNGADLEVIAPDERWDSGLEGYLKSYKQELINELVKDNNLPARQEDFKNIEHNTPATTATTATNGTNSAIPFATSLLQTATKHSMGDTGNIVNSYRSFGCWLDQLKQCATNEQVFSLLDEFRPLSWSDDERAKMSHAYINRLNFLNSNNGNKLCK